MYYLPIIFSFLFVLALILKFSTTMKDIKKIQNKIPFPTRKGGSAYLDMDEEEEQGQTLDKLDFLATARGNGNGNEKKKINFQQDDPFHFSLGGGESKSYTPLFSPEKKRNSLSVTVTGTQGSPQSTPPAHAQGPPLGEHNPSMEFADFADFVTVGFDT
jgi:hypothetical protein